MAKLVHLKYFRNLYLLYQLIILDKPVQVDNQDLGKLGYEQFPVAINIVPAVWALELVFVERVQKLVEAIINACK